MKNTSETPTSFFDKLRKRCQEANTLVCVGIDPHPEDLERFGGDAEGALSFALDLVEKTHPYAAAFKINSAFFEALGPAGVLSLSKAIIRIRQRGVPVILDAKRGDIGSTAKAYASSAFGYFEADSMTVNPYLGMESLQPFLDWEENGVWVLCRTSNPGSNLFQGYTTPDGPPYLQIASLVSEHPNAGLVVGATQVEELRQVRENNPETWLLCPGVGAQGGDLGEALKAGLRQDGMGVLINSSRSIARAPSPADAAKALRDKINESREPKRLLVSKLWEAGHIQLGEFTLKDGSTSPVYINLRGLSPRLLSWTVSLLFKKVESALEEDDRRTPDLVAGAPLSGLVLATAMSLHSNKPLVYPRLDRRKQYGTKSKVEGRVPEGHCIALLVDDVLTSGGTKGEAIEALHDAGVFVDDIAVIVDRSEGGGKCPTTGRVVHSLLTLEDVAEHLLALTLGDVDHIKDCIDRLEDHFKRLEDYVNAL